MPARRGHLIAAARPTGVGTPALVPSTPDLAGATVELPVSRPPSNGSGEALAPTHPDFDQVVIDCPPSLGPLSVNALVAADRVIVPVQAEYLALEGLAQFLDTLALIQRELNPRLQVAGMLLDDVRQPHAPRPGRRAGAPRVISRPSSSAP